MVDILTQILILGGIVIYADQNSGGKEMTFKVGYSRRKWQVTTQHCPTCNARLFENTSVMTTKLLCRKCNELFDVPVVVV